MVGTDHTSTLAAEAPQGLLALTLADPARAADEARAFHGRAPLTAVFGVDDDTTVVAAHVAAALGLQHNSIEACLAARDKHRQRTLLAAAGVPVPAFALHRFDGDLAALARATPYPCVIKPTRLAMSRGVMRADAPRQLLEHVERLRRILDAPDAQAACGEAVDVFLVEGFVPGIEVAVEGLMRQGVLTVLAVFDKPDPLDGPFFEETIYVTPSRLGAPMQAQVATLVERAARAIGVSGGPVHAEVRVGETGAVLIELAARPIGGRCSAVLRFGPEGRVLLEEVLLRHALGRPQVEADLRREAGAAAVMMIPTPRGGVLRRVDGVAAAKLEPWVDDVIVTAHAGQELVPLPEGSRYLGFIYAFAPAATTAEAAVRAAHQRLAIEIT